jgi:hypothetical protein
VLALLEINKHKSKVVESASRSTVSNPRQSGKMAKQPNKRPVILNKRQSDGTYNQ